MYRYKAIAFLTVGLAFGVAACSRQQLVPDQIDPVLPEAMAEAEVPGIGRIGKWMIDPDGGIADWGGMLFEGQTLHEVINVIFVDSGASSADDAKKRLVNAMVKAGYPVRYHHSSGYRGVIDGEIYKQLPEEDAHAFSNRIYVLDNNHGRIFGPRKTASGWVFTGALSREHVDYIHRVHVYASFVQARDDLASHLTENSIYKRAESVPLNNGSTADYTTGDHDGNAVVMRAR